MRLRACLCLLVVLSLGGCASAPPRIDPGRTNPQAVVDAALAVEGAPYRYGAEGPRAFDCSGLVYYAHRQAGLEVPRSTSLQYRNAMPIELDYIRPGDVLFFRLAGKISHVGLYTGADEFIHAPSSGKHVAKARLDNPYWRTRLIGAGRLVAE